MSHCPGSHFHTGIPHTTAIVLTNPEFGYLRELHLKYTAEIRYNRDGDERKEEDVFASTDDAGDSGGGSGAGSGSDHVKKQQGQPHLRAETKKSTGGSGGHCEEDVCEGTGMPPGEFAKLVAAALQQHPMEEEEEKAKEDEVEDEEQKEEEDEEALEVGMDEVVPRILIPPQQWTYRDIPPRIIR